MQATGEAGSADGRCFLSGGELTPADIIKTVAWLEAYRRKMAYREASAVWGDIIAGKLVPLFCARLSPQGKALCGLIVFSLKGETAECEAVCGEGFIDAFDYVEKADWAALGVKTLKFEGRCGWLKKAERHGWKQTKLVMEKAL